MRTRHHGCTFQWRRMVMWETPQVVSQHRNLSGPWAWKVQVPLVLTLSETAGRFLCTHDPLIRLLELKTTSQRELDLDTAVQEAVRSAARALVETVPAQRTGEMVNAGSELHGSRQK